MSVACMDAGPDCHQGGSVPGIGKGAGGTGLTIHVRAGNRRQEQSIKPLGRDVLLACSCVCTSECTFWGCR